MLGFGHPHHDHARGTSFSLAPTVRSKSVLEPFYVGYLPIVVMQLNSRAKGILFLQRVSSQWPQPTRKRPHPLFHRPSAPVLSDIDSHEITSPSDNFHSV